MKRSKWFVTARTPPYIERRNPGLREVRFHRARLRRIRERSQLGRLGQTEASAPGERARAARGPIDVLAAIIRVYIALFLNFFRSVTVPR